MNKLQWIKKSNKPGIVPCCRCERGDQAWDRLADKAYCPECQEELALGEGEPLVETLEPRHCTICDRRGTVRFHTFPLRSTRALGMDLCAEHVRRLLSRELTPFAFHQLCRQLGALKIQPDDVFLLHNAFYDKQGRALQPAIGM